MAKLIITILVLSAIWLLAACGEEATPAATPEAAPPPAAPPPPAPAAATPIPAPPAPTPAVAPIAVPTPAPTPPPKVGIIDDVINVGLKEIGALAGMGDPKLLKVPQNHYLPTTLYETFVTVNPKGEVVPRLADWSVSEDGRTWTFKLQEGVPFHRGFGEMTAQDMVWTWDRATEEGTTYGGAGLVRVTIEPPENQVEIVDDHTISITHPKPRFDMLWNIRAPWVVALPVYSKAAFDAGDIDLPVGTGPWELVEARSGEFWKMEAVEDHWRKTPFFRGLTLWEIPEESTRLAGLETGSLDTGAVGFESIERLKKAPGMKFLSVPEAAYFSIFVWGQYYVGDRPGYKPEFPWVSSNSDVNSPEWDTARKVRLALALAIDRELIVETILKGEGRPQHYWEDTGNTWMDPLKATNPEPFKYNPARAKQLLAEAGYSGGFEAPLQCSNHGIPGEIEACEAVGSMWGAIGVKPKITKFPYGTVRPDFLSRSMEGFTGTGSGVRPEPILAFKAGIIEEAAWASGLEHPIVEALMVKGFDAFEREERQKILNDVSRFLRDNVTHIPVYAVGVVYPVGPKIDVWQLQGGEVRLVHNFEFIPPRQ